MLRIINDIAILPVIVVSLVYLFKKSHHQSRTWKATVTPLASIIGSGFLIVTPILLMICGKFAPLAITGIVVLAYLMGTVLRFNIMHFDSDVHSPKLPRYLEELERLSYITLSISYLISITFYIKLMAFFLLRGISSRDELYANIITTVFIGGIGLVGKLKGFHRLELMEEYSVNIKLSIIMALLAGLALYNGELLRSGHWQLAIATPPITMETIRQLLGVIIIVQGFETSRYLSKAYSSSLRVSTMRSAQIISGVIYVAFICLSMVMFDVVDHYDETTIIDITAQMSVVLPILLIIAAVFSQFSAALADMIGAGGLILEAIPFPTSENNIYLVIAIIAIALTWATNVFEIIALASRAFSFYYAIQSLEAALVSFKAEKTKMVAVQAILFSLLAVLLFLAAVFGIPV